MKHSPGPWFISNNYSDMRPEAIHAEGHANCIVATTWSIVPEEYRKANAKLIAAAPSLLAAVCKLQMVAEEYIQEHDEETHSPADWAKEILAVSRQAIAKATEGQS